MLASLTQGHRPFERRGLVQGALAHMQIPNTGIDGQALERTIDRLSNLEELSAIGHSIGKFPRSMRHAIQVRVPRPMGRHAAKVLVTRSPWSASGSAVSIP